MLITISITAPQGAIEQDLITLDVGQEITIGALKAVIQGDTNVEPPLQTLFHNNVQLLDDSKTLEQCQIQEDAMLGMLVEHANEAPSASHGGRSQGRQQPGRRDLNDAEMETVRLQALGSPHVLAQLRAQNPELADAVPDPLRFRQVWHNMRQYQRDIEAEKQRELALLNADPFNEETQKKIEEIIREERVMENVQSALDYNPEVFGRVHMLYVPVEVNNHSVKAFVDSGAQATIMSPSCAESCGIMRLIDKRYSGLARGVGTAQILGRVHSAQIKIGSLFLPCSFTVMEGKDVDLLLGLDMLKRHQACIDLNKSALVIQGEEIPFLGEAEIPKYKEPLEDEPTVVGPSGMRTGAISGAVSQTPAAEQGSSKGKGHERRGGAVTETDGIPATAAAAAPTTSSFPPEDIAKLMDMGMSREQAIHCLEAAGGNVLAAASMFF